EHGVAAGLAERAQTAAGDRLAQAGPVEAGPHGFAALLAGRHGDARLLAQPPGGTDVERLPGAPPRLAHRAPPTSGPPCSPCPACPANRRNSTQASSRCWSGAG